MVFLESMLIVVSLFLLYSGANILVKGAASCALWLGVSQLAIGLTVVAYLTSAPELFVSVLAAYEGNSAISIGNVIGSNIFNILAILGLSAIICPLKAKKELARFDLPLLIVLSCVFGLLLFTGEINRISACLLLLGIVFYTIYHLTKKNIEIEIQEDIEKLSVIRSFVYLSAGLGVVLIGSKLLLSSSIAIAKAFSISDDVIAVTLIAAGTSVPELSVSIVAACKKNHDISVGNIVGSNIFNIAAVMGLSALISPLDTTTIQSMLWRDLTIMTVTSIWLYSLVRFSGRITRLQGILFMSSYVIYVLYLLKNA